MNTTRHLREALAEYAHKAWAGWMKHLFSKCYTGVGQFDMANGTVVIPKELVDRWKRQIATAYEDLPEGEKESDRAEADKMIQVFTKDVYKHYLDITEKKIKEVVQKSYFASSVDPLIAAQIRVGLLSSEETDKEFIRWLTDDDIKTISEGKLILKVEEE